MANFNEQSPLVKLSPLFIYLCKIIDVVFSSVFVVFHKKTFMSVRYWTQETSPYN